MRGETRSALEAKLFTAIGKQSSKALPDDPWFTFDAPRRYPDRIDSRELQVLLSQWIGLESLPGSMGVPAIDFHCESLIRPIGVDLMLRHERVQGRPWKASSLDEVKK